MIVLFTDGKTTAGPPPAPVAAAARAEGIILYCISLIGSDGIDVSVLNDWATDPDASHVAVTPDAADLEDLFRDLAANISKTGATDIVIDEVVSADFQFAVFDAGDVRLESLGRILELNFTVKRVCPGKRVALGVLLSEVGENGDEYPRGMKALTLPAHNAPPLPGHPGQGRALRAAGGPERRRGGAGLHVPGALLPRAHDRAPRGLRLPLLRR